jgi:hypothetical protein
MAQSLGEKLVLLFKSTMNDIVSRALEGNAIKVLREVLREHEEGYDLMESNMIVTKGALNSAERRVQEYTKIVQDLNEQITRILTNADPTDDDDAKPLATDLVGKEAILKNEKEILVTANRTHQAMIQARNKLSGRIISLKNQIRLLEAIESETVIKNMSADILIDSAKILSSGGVSVERMAEVIKSRRDKADARFEMANLGMNSSRTESSVEEQADAKLAEIRARLGLATGQESKPDLPEQSRVSAVTYDMSEEELKQLKAS